MRRRPTLRPLTGTRRAPVAAEAAGLSAGACAGKGLGFRYHLPPARSHRMDVFAHLSRLSRLFRRAGATSVPLIALVVLAAGIALAPAAVRSQAAEANPPLPHVFLQAGIHRIKAEVADSQLERSRGLMLRESLQPNSGMLFVFDRANVHCFWMKNTLVPLTIAFLEADGTIVTLKDMQPHDETSNCPDRPVRYALEMEQGWFKTKGLKTGDRVKGLPEDAPAAPARR
jgi:uncharacterized membrane protein (UPF0127 family)